MSEDCKHPPDKVTLHPEWSDLEEVDVPQYWTVLGECDCGTDVEVNFKFESITGDKKQ